MFTLLIQEYFKIKYLHHFSNVKQLYTSIYPQVKFAFGTHFKTELYSEKSLLFNACAETGAGSFVGQYQRNFPLKIYYSCIGIKLCDSTTPVPVKVWYVFLSEYLQTIKYLNVNFVNSSKRYIYLNLINSLHFDQKFS